MNWRPDDSPATVFAGLLSCARDLEGSQTDRMRAVATMLWDILHPRGVSWIGFYRIAGEANDHGVEPGDGMLLGPHRDKPACSPIGMHGACGQSFSTSTTLVVSDVAYLGEGYVACDPLDLAELVIPCVDEDGTPWGVLDADSFERGCFDERDAAELFKVLHAAGLTHGEAPDVRLL